MPTEHAPLLNVRGLSKAFSIDRNANWAVRDASLTIHRSECLALVGESGSGKTTLASMIAGRLTPTSGEVTLGELDVASMVRTRSGRQEVSRRVQFVFQDPYGSLDPTKPVERLVAEPLLLLGLGRKEREIRVRSALDMVGLPAAYSGRRPRELSGGQRQRVGIARALAPEPELLVLDEPVASLDVSIQGQILTLLQDIRSRTGVAVLVIAHDLGVVRAIAERTMVMYRGSIVETGPTADVLSSPYHPYAQALRWSATAAGRDTMPIEARQSLAEDSAQPAEDDRACVFRDRCWRVVEECHVKVAKVGGPDHWADCNVPMSTPGQKEGLANVSNFA